MQSRKWKHLLEEHFKPKAELKVRIIVSSGKEILTELEALGSTLGKLSKEMPFEIPKGYFEKMPERLHLFSKLESLAFDTKEMPFEVPKKYFKELPSQLATTSSFVGKNSKLEQEETVPEGYFESMPHRMTAHVKTQEIKKGRRISLGVFRKIRWATAAVLLLSISFGTLHYLELRNTPDAVAARQLAKIDPNELANYVNQHLDEFDNENIEAAVSTSKTGLNTTLSEIDATSIKDYLNYPQSLN